MILLYDTYYIQFKLLKLTVHTVQESICGTMVF